MSVVMPQRLIGNGWVPVPVGEFAETLDQFYWFRPEPEVSGWYPISFVTADKLPIRPGSNYRRPVSIRAKLSAAWAARRTLWRRLVLRRPAF